MNSNTPDQNAFASLVAHELIQSERQLDVSGARLTALLTTIFEGRVPAGIAACVGQSGLQKTAAALSALVEARGQIIGAHSHFERDGRRLGLDWSMSGLTESKPITGAAQDDLAAAA
ncbi:MAG: hypothetical protein EON91_02770 [Brevundimonas sp.]|uniref:hypothetical protein n=1 Tax=Brevundimonas sp. TaxID=1871086 RepID=UPI00122A24A8|nr:hypothetical protein [Brevundimonas sp.]RZJ19137.1 MAG: hypothetical protein EON91_02770 [Brevundimonas sp.]